MNGVNDVMYDKLIDKEFTEFDEMLRTALKFEMQPVNRRPLIMSSDKNVNGLETKLISNEKPLKIYLTS